MIEHILDFSLRHRGWVLAAAVLLAWAGVRAVHQTPMDAIPDLSENQVIVFTDWPGHGPSEVEDRVTRPLMDHLNGIRGVRTVRSSSDVSFSMIHVVFDDRVDVPTARQRVDERVRGAAVDLPPDARAALAPEAPATGQIFWYVLEGGADLADLRSVQDFYVRGQLASVDGVAEVASVGGFRREFQIDVDPLRMAARGVSWAQTLDALRRAQRDAGGGVVHKAGQEYVASAPGSLGMAPAENDGSLEPKYSHDRALGDLRRVVVGVVNGVPVTIGDVAQVVTGAAARRGALEMDGNEMVGGVVMMRYGENPRDVSRRLLDKIRQLRAGLPPGVRIVPTYDRTPLVEAAVATVTRSLVEAVITSVVCVLVILLHVRSSLVIAVTLPLSTLASFVLMSLLRATGAADIPTNIMSLSGLAISIGVLVDSSIVITENVMHRLRAEVGDRPVVGDTRAIVYDACRTVARPIVFSILIMLVSFLPVLVIGGGAGKMFRPLAFTKVFALASVAVLAVTLVPVLCSYLVRGRMRREEDSWVVRTLIDVYRPLLSWLLDRPVAVFWLVTVTLLLGFAPLGVPFGVASILALGLGACFLTAHSRRGQFLVVVSLLAIGLGASRMKPLEHETNYIAPLDEGTVMDMPITIPRVSLTQALDDMKARDMILCRFPEVEMAMGKVGRAETPTDPAPVDMIETMVSLRPREYWPHRKLTPRDARRIGRQILEALVAERLIEAPADAAAANVLLDGVMEEALLRFDAQLREYAYHRNREFLDALGRDAIAMSVHALVEAAPNAAFHRRPSDADIAALASELARGARPHHGGAPGVLEIEDLISRAALELEERDAIVNVDALLDDSSAWTGRVGRLIDQLLARPSETLVDRVRRRVASDVRAQWLAHVRQLNGELIERGAATWTRLLLEELPLRASGADQEVVAALERLRAQRVNPPRAGGWGASHHGGQAAAIDLNPIPAVDRLQVRLTREVAASLVLWKAAREDLGMFGGEMDQALRMPGWTNVWTRPIQNRVDMLNTGVGSTAVAIRVLGNRLDDVVDAGDLVAAAVKELPGATNVIADPVRGKGFLEIRVDRERATSLGVDWSEAQDLVQAATGGVIVGQAYDGHARHAIRIQVSRQWREDETSLGQLPIPVRFRGSDRSASASSAAGRPVDEPTVDEVTVDEVTVDEPTVGEQSLSGRSVDEPASNATLSDSAAHDDSAPDLPRFVPLERVATLATRSGPAAIKGENGLLRTYVRLDVRDRDAAEFVEQARTVVARRVSLPAGVYLEWTGGYEYWETSRRTLWIVVPAALGLTLLLLYWTYRDVADALLMLLAVPGAVAGGLLLQWLWGGKFSMTVAIGYLSCFGMATSTGVIMLVYLRESVASAGGLESLTLEELRTAVLRGAVHRLRPKLLAEATTLIGLAPMIWATGVGAEVIGPMAVPVLGGILVADEVIDLFLPVMFYWVRRRRWRKLADRSRKAIAS